MTTTLQEAPVKQESPVNQEAPYLPAPSVISSRVVPTNEAIQLADGYYYGCYKKCTDGNSMTCTTACGTNICDSDDKSCYDNAKKYTEPMYKVESKNLDVYVNNMMDPNEFKVFRDGKAYLPRTYMDYNIQKSPEAVVKQFTYLDRADPPRLDQMLSYNPPPDSCVYMTPCKGAPSDFGVCCGSEPIYDRPFQNKEGVAYAYNDTKGGGPTDSTLNDVLGVVGTALAYASTPAPDSQQSLLDSIIKNIMAAPSPTNKTDSTTTPPPPATQTIIDNIKNSVPTKPSVQQETQQKSPMPPKSTNTINKDLYTTDPFLIIMQVIFAIFLIAAFLMLTAKK